MATIEKLICNLKEEVSKWFYQKGEVDEKVNSKADNSLVTGSSNGLMSSSDKIKLDGVATGANKTTVDSAMSSTSTNPVQNKIVTQELNSKSDEGHTHSISNITNLQSTLNGKASTTVASTSANGLMTSAMVAKLNGIATGANKTVVDSAMSSTSTNPVQNKVVNAQLTSLNNNKANTNHTHNNYTATTTVTCNYGTVKKFKKNGWAFVVYENINISPLSLESWTVIADIGWSNQAGNSYTANFQTSIPGDRFRITADGKLSAMKLGDSNHQGHYGYIVYPTSD